MELYRAIVKMEVGDVADGVLKVRCHCGLLLGMIKMNQAGIVKSMFYGLCRNVLSIFNLVLRN